MDFSNCNNRKIQLTQLFLFHILLDAPALPSVLHSPIPSSKLIAAFFLSISLISGSLFLLVFLFLFICFVSVFLFSFSLPARLLSTCFRGSSWTTHSYSSFSAALDIFQIKDLSAVPGTYVCAHMTLSVLYSPLNSFECY